MAGKMLSAVTLVMTYLSRILCSDEQFVKAVIDKLQNNQCNWEWINIMHTSMQTSICGLTQTTVTSKSNTSFRITLRQHWQNDRFPNKRFKGWKYWHHYDVTNIDWRILDWCMFIFAELFNFHFDWFKKNTYK